MKKINEMSADRFLRLLFGIVTGSLLLAAVCMPDRAEMFTGLRALLGSTAKTPTNGFAIGGMAGTFLNAAIVSLACTLLYFLPGAKAGSGSVIAVFLTVGFAFWNLNIVNMWFGMPGILLVCLLRRQKPGEQVNAMLFTTGLAPIFSDLLFRYPGTEVHGATWAGFGLALLSGLIIGFLLVPGMAYSPKMHGGYSLYSAALPMGLIAFFLRAVFYTLPGAELPGGPAADPAVASRLAVNLFFGILFGLAVVLALLMGSRGYLNVLRDSGWKTDFPKNYGNADFLMNFGVYGLFILLYYNVIGANFNAVTLGCIFCMLSLCASGSHPGNVWPIMGGYVLASLIFGWLGGPDYALGINAQAIVIGLCFASGLAPVSGRYGWLPGIIAGVIHYCLVTCVPALHGGFLLYNGGFTAAFTAFLLVPVLEYFCRVREGKKQNLITLGKENTDEKNSRNAPAACHDGKSL